VFIADRGHFGFDLPPSVAADFFSIKMD